MRQEKITKDTLSFGEFTPAGTANLISKNKGVVMAMHFGVVPMVVALDFAACPGCIQRGYKRCQDRAFCPVLAANLPRLSCSYLRCSACPNTIHPARNEPDRGP
jgi:hypothetical protein